MKLADRSALNAQADAMKRIFVALVATFAVLLPLSASHATAQTDGVMEDSRAGRVYLDAVCPANRVAENFSRKIWRGRKTIPYAEVDRRLPEIRRLSGALGRAKARASRKLFNPPALWPTDVDSLVTKLANVYAKESYWLLAMSGADSGREWGRYNNRYNKISPGTASSQIRARLGLPPNGQGC